MRESTKHLKSQLNIQIAKIEDALAMDVLSIFGPIVPSLEDDVKEAVEKIPSRKKAIAVIHDTPGGVVEVVERMVKILRYHYKEVVFIIPNRAMSAGTVFALSGDKIYMNYFSCLGPIDPQIERNIDGKPRLVPALSYVNQYNKIVQKSQNGTLDSVEFSLLKEQFNLSELETFIQAVELTEDLLKTWLVEYKFKNWRVTETNQIKITKKIKQERAKEIAKNLSDYKRWHSHSRMIDKETLEKIGLKINDFSEIDGLKELVDNYYGLLTDFMQNEDIPLFIHNKEHF